MMRRDHLNNIKGQVMVVAVLLLMVVAAFMLTLVNITRTADSKMRLQTSADAAAKTGAVWQAATAIRNEHRDVKKYIEYTAILLFFKFYDDVYDTLPSDIRGLIPSRYRWRTLKGLDPRGFDGYHPAVRIRLR